MRTHTILQKKNLTFDKVCHKTYFTFVHKYVETLNANTQSGIMKWEAELGLDLDPDDCRRLYATLYGCTACTSLRSFQFFVLHRAIVTNVNLYKWRIKDSAACVFCQQHPESIFHLLWECNITSTLWTSIFTWLNLVTETNIVFSPKEIILGSGLENLFLYDLVFLVAKKYMYASRCLGILPTFRGFLLRLKRIYETETQAAQIYHKEAKCARKWALLADSLI